MKLSSIKTKTEFYEFADIWYQRTIRLKEIFDNKLESDKRRSKAILLWFIMLNRMQKLISISVNISCPMPTNFDQSKVCIIGEGK